VRAFADDRNAVPAGCGEPAGASIDKSKFGLFKPFFT
jgi:hypothetical protein